MVTAAPLAREARREEREERQRLDELESSLDALQAKRHTLIRQLLELSEEQKKLYDQRGPQQARLEAIHDQHRAIGRELGRVRGLLDAAHRRRDELLVRLQLLRSAIPRTARVPTDRIRREMQRLELEQQTRALPLAEENALIGRLRQLRKELGVAESESGALARMGEELRHAEAEYESARAEVDRLRKELDRLRTERDEKMAAMKAGLVEVGRLVAAIREKAQARGTTRDQIDAVTQQGRILEREFDTLRQRYRQRRAEARRLVVTHNRPARRAVRDSEAADRTVDEQLQTLLKEGKITLGG